MSESIKSKSDEPVLVQVGDLWDAKHFVRIPSPAVGAFDPAKLAAARASSARVAEACGWSAA